MRCDRRGGEAVAGHAPTFQSLSGFLMRCDRDPRPDRSAQRMFQSLSGFLMRCDALRRAGPAGDSLPVSIPIGFSDAL